MNNELLANALHANLVATHVELPTTELSSIFFVIIGRIAEALPMLASGTVAVAIGFCAAAYLIGLVWDEQRHDLSKYQALLFYLMPIPIAASVYGMDIVSKIVFATAWFVFFFAGALYVFSLEKHPFYALFNPRSQLHR